jgi:hypothetical protein
MSYHQKNKKDSRRFAASPYLMLRQKSASASPLAPKLVGTKMNVKNDSVKVGIARTASRRLCKKTAPKSITQRMPALQVSVMASVSLPAN